MFFGPKVFLDQRTVAPSNRPKSKEPKRAGKVFFMALLPRRLCAR
jgi:hypothetical protein